MKIVGFYFDFPLTKLEIGKIFVIQCTLIIKKGVHEKIGIERPFYLICIWY